MQILYFWVREYKNIKNLGFNLSSKVSFETIIRDEGPYDELKMSLTASHMQHTDLFPPNISDVKAILGQNGAGKSNMLLWLINFIMNKRTVNFGFIVTEEFIIIRDRIEFETLPEKVLGKELKVIYPEDIFNFEKTSFQTHFGRDDVFKMQGRNLMETYFKKKYLIYYSATLNQDNYFNSEGLQSSYFRWQSELPNYFDISTESSIVSDYNNFKNNPDYFISGESELLAYKYFESLRALNFFSEEEVLNLDIKFPIHSINVDFTGFNEKFWDSIDFIISRNSSLEWSIDRVLGFKKKDILSLGHSGAFLEQLCQELMYCIMSFQLKEYYNFLPEHELPVIELLNNLHKNYNSTLDSYDALYTYIRRSESFKGNEDFVIDQIAVVRAYFEQKFAKGEIIPSGIHGMVIPEHNIRSMIKDFLKPPLFFISTTSDYEEPRNIRLNMFGFELYGLSSGERSFLSLFSRLHYYKDRIKPGRDILFLIDEGELGFHPQWQKQYFSVLVDFIEKFFPKNTVQLIITSHSPFLASDLPTENILFLKKKENNLTEFHEEFSDKQTFASNIHALYSDAFFIQGATIGDFSKKILNEIIDYLNNGKYSPALNDKYRELIQKIGEPVIKNKLTELWIEKLGKEEEINALQERINFLRSQP